MQRKHDQQRPFHGGNEGSNPSGDVSAYESHDFDRSNNVAPIGARPPPLRKRRKGTGRWRDALSSAERQAFHSWKGASNRCSNPKLKHWPSYGGRGIRFWEGWKGQAGFRAFLAHIGLPPSPDHCLDRIDNDGHYEPGNVRWATQVEQNRNRRSNHLLTLDGRTQPISAWAEEVGCDRHLIRGRLRAGWSDRDAVLGRAPHPTGASARDGRV